VMGMEFSRQHRLGQAVYAASKEHCAVKDAPTMADLHGVPLRATRFVAEDDIRGRDVLDIGCGAGWFESFSLSKGVRTITGIDITEGDLRTAKRHLNSSNVHLQIASAIELPFADESFDTVVCWEVLEHIPPNTEHWAFQEIRRVLRPEGRLYLSTPHASISARLLDPAWWLIGHRHYSTSNLRSMAESAGLRVDILEVRGARWFNIYALNKYAAKWIFRRPPFLADYVNRKIDSELAMPNGSAGCFMKCQAG
jgi:ubiquinone/menaquinone biosynthesis C-methylase UbiE